MDDLLRDARYACRLLRRTRAFTVIVLLTVTLAIGAAVTVFGLVDAWLLRPLNFPEPDRLAIAFGSRRERPREPAVWLPYRAYLGWKERSRSFSSISAAFVRDATIAVGSDARAVLGLSVTPEFFRTLGVAPLIGRSLGEQDAAGPHVAVISHALWQRQFGGSPALVGDRVMFSGILHEIVGVMPHDFDVRALDMRFDFWTPFRPEQPGYQPGGIGPVALIGRLQRDVSLDMAQQEVAAITRDIESAHQINFNTFVINLTPLQADNTRTVRATLLTITAGVASLLLIASANIGALMLGRGLGRMREAAIRTAVGSSRTRLVRQFLTEGLLIVGAGGLGGLFFAWGGLKLFVVLNPLGALPPHPVALNPRILAFAALTVIATTLAAGLLPALRVSMTQPNDLLGTTGPRSSSGASTQRAQSVMLIAQIALSVVLLVVTTLLTRTVVRLQNEPLGFNPSGVVVASVVLPKDPFDSSEKRGLYYQQLAASLRSRPGVRAVAASTARPLNSGPIATVDPGSTEPVKAPRISTQDVTPEFFAALQIPVLGGRSFDARDSTEGAPAVILNLRAASDLFGGAAEAIGRRVRVDEDPWREVVGVVGNVRSTFFNTLEWKSDPIVYRPAAQAFARQLNPMATIFGMNVIVRTDGPLTLAEVREAARSIDPRAAVIELMPVPVMIDEATRQPAFRMALLSGFALVSLLLGGIGVYGVVSQSVAQRVRDMAIRIALGARPATIVAATIRRALITGIAGIGSGVLATYAMANSLSALLYGVRPRDAASVALAAGLLLAVAALGAFVPARRATRIDPVTVLRGE